MHSRIIALCAAVVLTPLTVSAQGARSPHVQQGVTVKEEKAGLLARATVRPDSATHIAMDRVPGGRVTKAEIEMEGGKLVYSFDLAVSGKSGVDEVLVDAHTGAIVSVEHESVAKERKEQRADKAKAAAQHEKSKKP